MSVIGIAILAHEHLGRTRALAKAIASAKVKVMIHIDANTDIKQAQTLRNDLSKNQHIAFCERVRCEWGEFSLVKAGMVAAQEILTRWPDVSHVVQISGSCLPVRPIGELVAFLERHQGRDFVESVSVCGPGWVIDGLGSERFSLFFPFSWRRQRMLFDLSVALQRRLKISRKIPSGITPHLGSQWWCLSRETLLAILNDPQREEYDAYFSKCWIPDEGYIPTLVKKHSRDLVCRSLTLSRFDTQGRPHMFYDDHADLLEQTDHFFARKIWHGADGLYRRFLKNEKPNARAMDSEFGLDLIFSDAKNRRCDGRPGRLTVGRFPATAFDRQPRTCRNYAALIGFGHVFEDFQPWLAKTTGMLAHGRLFKKNRVEFAHNADEMPGALMANPLIRDHNPEQFLCNLLWGASARHHSLMMELSDGERMTAFLCHDRNAQMVVLRGGWVLELLARGLDDLAILKRQAKRLAKAEQIFERELKKSGRADVHYVSLSDLVDQHDSALGGIQEFLTPHVELRPKQSLEFRDLSGLREFVGQLERLNIDISSLGSLPDAVPGEEFITPAIGARATA